jgi:hypothetical protein
VQFERLIACLKKTVESYGLYEIIDYVEVVTFERIFFICGNQDEHARSGEAALDELEAGQSGHLNIQEDKVDRAILHNLDGFEGIVAGSHQFEKRGFADIILQQFEG